MVERATVKNQGVPVSVGSWGWMGEGKEDMAHSTTCVYSSGFSTRMDSPLEKRQDYLLYFFSYSSLHRTFRGDPWYFASFCRLFSLWYFTKISILLMNPYPMYPPSDHPVSTLHIHSPPITNHNPHLPME